MGSVAYPSNFGHLGSHDEQLLRLGLLAERYFPDDPNTCLIKLRQLAEALAQLTASHVGLFASAEEKQVELLRRLQDHGILPREVSALFHEVRKAGNDANHKLTGDHRIPLLDPAKRASLKNRDCGVEARVMLDAVERDDPCELMFREDGTVSSDDQLPEEVQAQVATAIECLGLRQGQLNRARSRVWTACSRRARQYSRLAAKPKGQRTPDEAAMLEELAGELIAMGKSRSPFAAVARTCLIANKLGRFVVVDELMPLANAE